MSKPHPEEFRQDVVRVARNRGAGLTVERVSTAFGVHPMTLWKWMRRMDIDDGTKPGTASQENAELQEARRRIKLLEQENEILRGTAAYLSQAHLPEMDLPARERAGWGRVARHIQLIQPDSATIEPGTRPRHFRPLNDGLRLLRVTSPAWGHQNPVRARTPTTRHGGG
ncbi:transposase [Streptomyces phaeoluteigriseus]